jgi:N-acetylglucosamine kinase-like BadF-type ATPase
MCGYILGVDGGQTSTKLLIATTEGEVMWCAQVGTAMHEGADGSLQATERRLAHLLRQALSDHGCGDVTFEVVAMGMTDAEPGSPAIPAYRRAAECAVKARRYVVVHDAVTGLLGASAGRPGIVVIAGGGTVAYGFTEDGRSATSSGWGYIVGDEGSSWNVGRAAINAAFRSVDGRGPQTALVGRLFEHFRVATPIELKSAILHGPIGFAEIAALPLLVADAAAEGDAMARGILEKAGQDLAESAIAVAHALGLIAEPVSVYPTGGLFQERRFVLPVFSHAVRAQLPKGQVRPPMFEQVVGTLFLGLRELGRPVDDSLVSRVVETWEVKRRLPGAQERRAGALGAAEW